MATMLDLFQSRISRTVGCQPAEARVLIYFRLQTRLGCSNLINEALQCEPDPFGNKIRADYH